MRLPETDDRHQMLHTKVSPRLKICEGWRNKPERRVKDIEVPRAKPTPPLPPWLTFENLSIESVPLERKKEDYRPEELKNIAMKKKDQIDWSKSRHLH